VIPVVGIIWVVLLLPFWYFIDFRSVFGSNVRFTTHTSKSGHMELFCRVPNVSLFPICKFPVLKDWIIESFGSVIFRNMPRVALMRLRSINVVVSFNTFLYIWKFLCIDERLNVLFDSLSSTELNNSHLFMVDYFDLYTVSNTFVLIGFFRLRVSRDNDLLV
jgi:hypothetical protein